MLDTARFVLYDWHRVIRKGWAVEQIVEQGILYGFYGPLLTRHQQEIYELVVYQNLSLNEIAEQRGISKQAVSDLVRRATAQMQEYEKSLGLIERFRRIRRLCDELDQAAEELTFDGRPDSESRAGHSCSGTDGKGSREESQSELSEKIRTLTREIRREL